MAQADDDRGRELAELARQFLIWLKDNELPGVPNLRGTPASHFELYAGVYRKAAWLTGSPFERKMPPRLWATDAAEQRRFEELRLGATHVLMLARPIDEVAAPDGTQVRRNRIVETLPKTGVDRGGALTTVAPQLDSLKADEATLHSVMSFDFTSILQRADLVYDDLAAATAANFKHRFIFDYETPRRAYDANVNELLLPAELLPKPGSNGFAQVRAAREKAFRAHVHLFGTYESRGRHLDVGDYYPKWKTKQPLDAKQRMFRPTLLSDQYLKECFTEHLLTKDENYLMVQLPRTRLVYRLRWEVKPSAAKPVHFIVEPLLSIGDALDAAAVKGKKKPQAEDDDANTNLQFPIKAVVFHSLDGTDQPANRIPFGEMKYTAGRQNSFVVNYKAYVRWYYGPGKELDFGEDREWFERFTEVFFGDQSYPIALNVFPSEPIDRETLFLGELRKEAGQASGSFKEQLDSVIAWCDADEHRFVFTQGMKLGTEGHERELIGISHNDVYEWHPQTELVTTTPITTWLIDFQRGLVMAEVYKNTAGMLPIITVIVWGGVLVMTGGVLGLGNSLAGLARKTVMELSKQLAGKFVEKNVAREARPFLIAMLMQAIMHFIPKNDSKIHAFVHGLVKGYGGGAVSHYLSEIDDRLERQIKAIPRIAANIATRGGYRAYVIYEKVKNAVVKITGVTRALRLVLVDDRARLVAQQFARLSEYVGFAFLIILFVVVYLDWVYRERPGLVLDKWIEKQRKTLQWMVVNTGDEIVTYAKELQNDLRSLSHDLTGEAASNAVRKHDERLSKAIVGKLHDGVATLPAIADFLQHLLEEVGITDWEELKKLGFTELMARGISALPTQGLLTVQIEKFGAALGELIGTIMLERRIVPEGVSKRSKFMGMGPPDAIKGALAGGTWRALLKFAIYPLKDFGSVPAAMKRGLDHAGGLHTNRFSKSNHRDTSYRDLLRDLLGDEDELARRLARLADDAGLPAKLEKLLASARIQDKLPPTLETLLKNDDADWPADAIMFVLYTWLRLGLHHILEAFKLIEDDAPYAKQFKLSQLLDIIGLDIALDDKTLAALKGTFTRIKKTVK